MQIVIALAALVAVASAGLVSPFAYNAVNYGYSPYAYSAPWNYGYSAYAAPAVAPVAHAYAAPAITSYAAPAVATYAAPTVATYAAPAIATGFKSQYHAQDELGQASYGHSEPLQTHNAVQDAHGNKIGSYSYVSPDGQVIRTDYVADAAGFRVASNALPVGPTALPVGPVAVVDTPEVVAARAAHLAEVEAVKSRTKRGIAVLPASTAPLAYSSLAYAAPIAHHGYAYSAPIAHHGYTYSAPIAHPGYAYAAPIAHPAVAYASPAPLAYAAAPIATAAVREATLTTVVNNPGHAVSYRVD